MSDNLTPKQQAFIIAYLEDLNATNTAEKAGYKGSRATLASIGSENLRKPKIRKALDTLLAENAIGIDRIFQILSTQACGSISDFISKDNDGFVTIGLDKAKALGVLGLIEYLKIVDTTGRDGVRRQRWKPMRTVSSSWYTHQRHAALNLK
jgi:phage terminase small subunit